MKKDIFDDYAPLFAAITPNCMREVYRETMRHVYGSIVDCGSGPCKLAPRMLHAPNFLHYHGIDYSREMVALGQQLLSRLSDTRFTVQCESIDNLRGEYDCAVSLQSYYAWPNHAKALTSIHKCLVTGGKFVLGTANKQLDIEWLLSQESVDWMIHPLWDDYVKHNRQIAKERSGRFDELDELIGELRGIGFSVLNAHTDLYNGGLNYVVCMK